MPTKQPKRSINTLLEILNSESINTWFDLGLFLDRFKEWPSVAGFKGSKRAFNNKIQKGGTAFITFFFTIDGITVEVGKYARSLLKTYPDLPIHYIAGDIKAEADELIPDGVFRKTIPEMDGFDNWALYNAFFKVKLERGSTAYNELIIKFWKEVIALVDKLGTYIEENNISLLYLLNVCSNPGNVSLALATVLISEYLGIPVINNNHDFYWEGGHRKVERETKKLPKGPRDFFFLNANVGEFFSIIEMIYPWNSRSWMNVNINKLQFIHLIEKNGINPANVELISTAVDTESKHLSKRDIIKAYMQMSVIFANKKDTITVHKAAHHTDSRRSLKPILLGNRTIKNFDFVNNNIVFLQPTRVISRKSIELNFKLIKQLFENENFRLKFETNKQLKLSILVSGPIPPGQVNYYHQLVNDFVKFLADLSPTCRSKVYLGFLFSEFDKHEFKKRYKKPLDINLLYDVASLILLPSKTEGRGLPIIEAAACGTPIFCRQYEPRAVYDAVIGYHLDESMRLRVLEFKGNKIPITLIEKITDHVFYPQNRMEEVTHNREVIEKRYSLNALQKNLEKIIDRLRLQLSYISSDVIPSTKDLLKTYDDMCFYNSKDLKQILNQETRHYMPGYGRLSFMIYLKSLIDPSFFRVEEQLTKGMVFNYARNMERDLPNTSEKSDADIHLYYNMIEDIFRYVEGEYEIRHDHSFAYRHRNKKLFSYQRFTLQELTGLVNMIYKKVFNPAKRPDLTLAPQFFADWELSLFQLTNSNYLGIDDRKILADKLKEPIPKGYFPGRFVKHELEYFVLQPIRAQLDLSIEQELTASTLKALSTPLEKIYIFVPEARPKKWFSSTHIIEYLESDKEPELSLLYRAGIVKVIPTTQWTEGVHFPQMGSKAIKILGQIKSKNGFLITNGDFAAMMSDIIDIDHFHIGKVEYTMTSKFMGIPRGSGFIQFVPAGVRTTLAYPTPIQTSKDFYQILNSKMYANLKEKLGASTLLNLISKDAIENGSPFKDILASLESELDSENNDKKVKTIFTGSVYKDGLPWSGVIAEIDTKKHSWQFAAHIANEVPKNVPSLIDEFKAKNKLKSNVELAWNGGYILNPELVGKLGLPEAYIGSPLGLLIMDEKVFSPPLFNKPAFIIYKDGSIDIRKVNCSNGISVTCDGKSIDFKAALYNKHSDASPCYYDLLYDQDKITGDGNTIIRLAGNVIKEIIHSWKNKNVKMIPVGLTLSLPKDHPCEKYFKVGQSVTIELTDPKRKPFNWNEISYAIEAGPMLIDNKKLAIDMEGEGWKTLNSIHTQAARIDYTDMRGPKIAVGITKNNKLLVLMVNGRIRESVGATHIDMAEILAKYGVHKAMGFDPGGSSTLVVGDKIMNISPYNKEYEKDIYALPPEPRFVASAIMGWIKQ